jgi:TPP-dependent pyruvate/acetoin dehydrogenase alpha subunit
MKPVVLRWLYHEMLRVRLIEEVLTARQGAGRDPSPSIGQEAIAVGTCFSLTPQDQVYSNPWSAATYLARSGDLRTLLAPVGGTDTRGAGELTDARAGYLGSGTFPSMIEAAASMLQRGEKHLVVCFHGVDLTKERDFSEALALSALQKLPVLFVGENNGHSLCTAARQQGVESVSGDGNDVEQVAEQALRAVEKARTGCGPTFLEYRTNRWLDTGSSSNPERCPIKRLGDRLLREGQATAQQFRAMIGSIQEEIAQASRVVAATPTSAASPRPQPAR